MLLNVKNGMETLFQYETTTDTPTSDLTKELVTLANLCSKIKKLTSSLDDLILYGPSKPLDQQGISEEQIQAMSSNIKEIDSEESKIKIVDGVEVKVSPDPTGRRIGLGLNNYFKKYNEFISNDR